MRKFIYLISLAVFVSFTGCVQQNGKPATKKEPKPLKIESFINSFISTHPKMFQNDIFKEDADKDFANGFIDRLKSDNLLEGYPMELRTMTKNNGRNMAMFSNHFNPDNFYYLYGIYQIRVDVIGAVSDSIVNILQEDKHYIISGHYIKRFFHTDEFFRTLGKGVLPYNNEVIITKGTLGYEVDLGMLQFEIDDVKPFKGREMVEVPLDNKTK